MKIPTPEELRQKQIDAMERERAKDTAMDVANILKAFRRAAKDPTWLWNESKKHLLLEMSERPCDAAIHQASKLTDGWTFERYERFFVVAKPTRETNGTAATEPAPSVAVGSRVRATTAIREYDGRLGAVVRQGHSPEWWMVSFDGDDAPMEIRGCRLAVVSDNQAKEKLGF